MHLGMHDFALHLHLLSRVQFTDGGNACFIEIAQGQMQQQALQIEDAQLGQTPLQRRGDALDFTQLGIGWQSGRHDLMANTNLGAELL